MNLFKVNFPPTVSLAYELSLSKESSPSYKNHIFTRSVEEVTKGLWWVADENTPLASRFELIMSLASHESLATPNLDVVYLRYFTSPHLVRSFGNFLCRDQIKNMGGSL